MGLPSLICTRCCASGWRKASFAPRTSYGSTGLAPGLEIRLPLTWGVIGFVARTGSPLRLRDVHNDPRFDPTTDERTGYETRSILCLPVLDADGTVQGAIQLINKLDGVFSEEDEAAVAQLAAEVEPLLRRSP
jgi:adenylate cyclase